MLASRCPPPLSPNYTCKAYLKTTTFRRPPTILTAAASRFRVRLLKSLDNNRNKRARRVFRSPISFSFSLSFRLARNRSPIRSSSRERRRPRVRCQFQTAGIAQNGMPGCPPFVGRVQFRGPPDHSIIALAISAHYTANTGRVSDRFRSAAGRVSRNNRWNSRNRCSAEQVILHERGTLVIDPVPPSPVVVHAKIPVSARSLSRARARDNTLAGNVALIFASRKHDATD